LDIQGCELYRKERNDYLWSQSRTTFLVFYNYTLDVLTMFSFSPHNVHVMIFTLPGKKYQEIDDGLLDAYLNKRLPMSFNLLIEHDENKKNLFNKR